MAQRDPGPVPERWLKCPRKSDGLIISKFLAYKTPLGPDFNDKVPEGDLFNISMLFNYLKSNKVKLGLWIDLTNTSRFYDKDEILKQDCLYEKLSCRGHGETPSKDQVKDFNTLVDQFIRNNPLEAIGVHCTHGFNRSGFMIVSYMVEMLDWDVEAAIMEFAKMRPPGIYKPDYLKELCARYNSDVESPNVPNRPSWCYESESDSGSEEEQNNDVAQNSSNPKKKHKKSRRDIAMGKKSFMAGVPGVEHYTESNVKQILKKIKGICNWKGSGFPGSQPVSMNKDNLRKLWQKPYRVSWKADGMRYMMFIDGENEVYMVDRDNCLFKVKGLKFLSSHDLTHHLKDTLLDGEMVIDKVKDKEFPRYLCYDVISLNGQNVSTHRFYPNRLSYIQKEIVDPRHHAMSKGIIIKDKEPFSIRLKQFWDIPMARQLLGEKFAKSLSHEPDGLIFQPVEEPYVAGQCDDVLKWKPCSMNSVDFQLKVFVENGEGIVPRKIGALFVGQLEKPYAFLRNMKLKNLKELDNKIIECKLNENYNWVFMRERTDKSFPNSFRTAEAVLRSIKNPVTEHILLYFIDHKKFPIDSEMMPPPPKRSKF